MNLIVNIPSEIDKKIFRLKPMKSNGLVLRIHHTLFNKRIRFVHSCFRLSNDVLALADNQGNVFIIDYSLNKFWGLPQIGSSTFIEFSQLNENQLLIGIDNGEILICYIHSGHICGKLLGHKLAVSKVSFAKQKYLLSTSKYEAIVWDFKSITKLQVLNLEKDCSLKYVSFIPISGNILACFQDDLIQIWSFKTFQTMKQFSPSNWKNYLIKCISFTQNGQVMVVAGYQPSLALFHLDSSKLLKTISLSDYLQTIKKTEFISQALDGGNNKILAVLSGQGVLYFLNVEEDIVLSELKCEMEISRFVCSFNGNHLLCLLCSGEVEIYNIQQYVIPAVKVQVQKVKKKFKISRKRCLEEVKFVKEEIDKMLDIKKLKFILKEYGQYPDIHRTKIWERLLELPNNLYKYNSIINHVTTISFDNLYEKYPLEEKLFLKSLKKLLNNLVTWCPFFANVDYLPIFAFPFVKVFHNKPLTSFEIVCTVILNWCQHWFEYFPLAPINVLAISENILLEHDPELLHHFVTHKITSNLYVWSLLENVFSEVLTSTEWLILWDHILTNEVSFLLCAAVAYNMVQRRILLSLKISKDFVYFYKNQNPIDAKRLIKVSYNLLKNTSEKFHPRQYFKTFASINKGKYPLFIDYPRKIVEFQKDEISKLDGCMMGLLAEQKSIINNNINSIDDVITQEEQQEEKKRLNEMNKYYLTKIKSKQQMLDLEQKKLQQMKTNLLENQCKGPSTIFEEIMTNTVYPTQESISKESSTLIGRKWKMSSLHRKKMQMAMNVELIDKFIKTIETELKKEDRELIDNYDTNNRNNLTATNSSVVQEDVASLPDEIYLNNKFTSQPKTCKRHDTENCLCDFVYSKTVRFSESTTGGSKV